MQRIKMKDFIKYADKVEKLSYVQCKESLLDFLHENSVYRAAIKEKALSPLELRMSKKTATNKLKLLERPDENAVKKPKQLYAKTGEVRLRDVSPTKLSNKHILMKHYGRWFVEPSNFNDGMQKSSKTKYIL
mmetsp:Transcript_10918/g.9637  ORF Transcript_10918/g.9637 Transcript_10918/m.9637 type:complete len:132 (-) Transcript_10918:22-417(-)